MLFHFLGIRKLLLLWSCPQLNPAQYPVLPLLGSQIGSLPTVMMGSTSAKIGRGWPSWLRCARRLPHLPPVAPVRLTLPLRATTQTLGALRAMSKSSRRKGRARGGIRMMKKVRMKIKMRRAVCFHRVLTFSTGLSCAQSTNWALEMAMHRMCSGMGHCANSS